MLNELYESSSMATLFPALQDELFLVQTGNRLERERLRSEQQMISPLRRLPRQGKSVKIIPKTSKATSQLKEPLSILPKRNTLSIPLLARVHPVHIHLVQRLGASPATEAWRLVGPVKRGKRLNTFISSQSALQPVLRSTMFFNH